MNCDECGGDTAVDDVRGEIGCTNCGLVVEQVIDISTPENFESFQQDLGIQMNTGLLVAHVRNDPRDGGGGRIKGDMRNRMQSLVWLNNHTARKRDRSFQRLFMMVTDICQKLGLSARRDRAFYIVKQAYALKVLHNQEFSLLVGGAVMLAAQESNVYIGLDAMLRVVNISRKKPKKQLSRAYREIKRTLNMPVRNRPEMALPVIAVKMGLSMKVITECRHILSDRPEALHRPEVELAAAIYVASIRMNLPVSQTKVAEACATSDVSLRVLLRESFPEYVPEHKTQILPTSMYLHGSQAG
jgi:transcription initiation factor TFIIIB Brf1 subunit/transcription initiation factor TFIIB